MAAAERVISGVVGDEIEIGRRDHEFELGRGRTVRRIGKLDPPGAFDRSR
jgi:hypothetical protein